MDIQHHLVIQDRANAHLPYAVLAFYHFTPFKNPLIEVQSHKAFCKNREITGRVYISEEGINGQMSGLQKDVKEYIEWVYSQAPFKEMPIKVHYYHENVFPRMTIKYRKQLVALDLAWDPENRGKHVSPAEWKQMLSDKQDKVLLDVRNDYEWAVGHFEGAELPPCDSFREFSDYAEQLSAKNDPKKTPVMMYCTGGIRCELYSSILKEKGFDQIYQLDGGIINYGIKEGSQHWLGKLFVFDDRMTVPISNEEAPAIGTCRHCQKTSEEYYNCANMDCNCLFLCCKECLHTFSGCCGSQCQGSARLRPYQHQNPHKPFRKKHHYN